MLFTGDDHKNLSIYYQFFYRSLSLESKETKFSILNAVLFALLASTTNLSIIDKS